jgi:hypothetical protein
MVVSITTLVEKGGCFNNVTFEKARSVHTFSFRFPHPTPASRHSHRGRPRLLSWFSSQNNSCSQMTAQVYHDTDRLGTRPTASAASAPTTMPNTSRGDAYPTFSDIRPTNRSSSTRWPPLIPPTTALLPGQMIQIGRRHAAPSHHRTTSSVAVRPRPHALCPSPSAQPRSFKAVTNPNFRSHAFDG